MDISIVFLCFCTALFSAIAYSSGYRIGWNNREKSTDEYIAMIERRLKYSRRHENSMMHTYHYAKTIHGDGVDPETVREMVTDYLRQTHGFIETQLWQDIVFSYKNNGGLTIGQYNEMLMGITRYSGDDER